MTNEIDKKTPIDRLNFSGSLEPVVTRLSTAYGVGATRDFSVIGVGYEDCNVAVEASSGKFVAKIFQKGRTMQDITRYATIMEKAVDAGVNHPPLLKTDGETVYNDSETGLNLVLMRFIEGKTFLELDRAPNEEERQAVIAQAAKINRIDYHPTPLFDSWAIPNIQVMFGKTKQFIASGDLKLVEEAMQRYQTIPIDSLLHCFVHGDFTKANILKSADGKMYVLDFSVANWYPRIQELAVIAANLLHDDKDGLSLRQRTELVEEEYSQLNPLSMQEQENLYDYTLAGVAMEFMGAHQEKYINGNDTEETEYWLKLGREGLRKALG